MTNGVNERAHPRRLAFYSLGFFRPTLRKLLKVSGYQLVPFGLGQADAVAVWGRKPVSKRGINASKKHNLPLMTIEDGFIRSLKPGWQDPPRALTFDKSGVYFDYQSPGDLRELLENPTPAPQAESLLELQIKLGISKYNQTPRGLWERKGYVLVVDQVKDDQSVTKGGANADRFREALEFAKREFPEHTTLIRTHPAGQGYYGQADLDERTELCSQNVNPFDLLEGAHAVVVVTSQMGFDAILAGHKPHVFGAPFYSGLGLSVDHHAQSHKPASRAALYDAAILHFPKYFAQDGAPSDAKTQIFALHDEAQQCAISHQPLKLVDQKAWKTPHLKRFFPNQNGDQIVRWGERHSTDEWVLEDGFLRSRGLGARLVPPLSLVLDQTGIYFDPTQPSDLERMIHARQNMLPLEIERAQNLQKLLISKNISKYNLPSKPVSVPQDRPALLVVGQVEDDRSILKGATGPVKTNAALLHATRRDHPDHFILYKPHPDVAAGLRQGAIAADEADLIVKTEGLDALWPQIDALATITSLSGFEALLRGKAVSCYGMPFYADWGLTHDFAPSTNRRGKSSLPALIYASLIDYPLYLDPKTRRFTTPEVIIERISSGETEYPAYLRAINWAQEKWYRARDYARKSSASN